MMRWWMLLLVVGLASALSQQSTLNSQKGFSQLPEEKQLRRPIRLTTELVWQPADGNKQFTDSLERAINVCKEFLNRRLAVQPMPLPIRAPSVCADFSTPLTDRQKGIANSDLHIYVLVRSIKEQSFVATGKACSYAAGSGGFPDRLMARGRPVVGRLIFNTAQITQYTTSQAMSAIISSLLHELIHILGFDRNLFHTYIDRKTQQPYGYNLTEEIVLHEKRGTSILLKTPKVTQWVRNYFGCESIAGAQLENEGKSSSQGSHWERSVFYDQLMTATTLGNDKHLSGLTLALLEDMGWYDITLKTELHPGIIFGRNRGCDFYNSICYSTNPFNEFCQTGIKKLVCSSDRLNKAVCMNKGTYSDGCGIRIPYQSCLTPPNSIGQLESYQNNARCFESDLSSKLLMNDNPLRCYHYKLITHQEVSVLSLADSVYCWQSADEIGINKTLTGYFGGVLCPNYPVAQLETLHCTNWCSGNGLCYAGRCNCHGNYSSEDCSVQCPEGHYYYQDNGACLKVCPSNYYKSSQDRTCRSCQQCTNSNSNFSSCSECSMPKQCSQDCLKCSTSGDCLHCLPEKYLLQSLGSIQCVEQCGKGSYKGSSACQPCYSSCVDCEGPQRTQCRNCRKGYFFYEGTCLSVCPTGTYQQQQDSLCVLCKPECSSCNSTHCLGCFYPKFLNSKHQCTDRCQSASHLQTKSQHCFDIQPNLALIVTLCIALFLL